MALWLIEHCPSISQPTHARSRLTYLKTAAYQSRAREESWQNHVDCDGSVPEQISVANLNVLDLSRVLAKVPPAWSRATGLDPNQLDLDASDYSIAPLDRQLAADRLAKATGQTVDLAGHLELGNHIAPTCT